jgi:hypothetical protein
MPYHTGIRLLLGGDCAPALIPLVQPGKGREARSVAALRPFNLFDLFRVGYWGFYIALPRGRRERNWARGVKNSAVLGPGCIFREKRQLDTPSPELGSKTDVYTRILSGSIVNNALRGSSGFFFDGEFSTMTGLDFLSRVFMMLCVLTLSR